MSLQPQDIITLMPDVRGKLRANADLSKVNWFRVGGAAELLFWPEDAADLAYFIARKPSDAAVTVVGVGSNLLVRDGGIDGVVIRLGRGFAECSAEGDLLIMGAGCLNANAVAFAQERGIGGLEFLSGIPGTVGGAMAMNAGAYGAETKDILVEAQAVDPQGRPHRLTAQDMQYGYRHCGVPEGWIFTGAVFQGKKEASSVIAERLQRIAADREAAQPVRARTGGSTFKNPQGEKAWRLIDAAGCRGWTLGAAQISKKHCNFMINTGSATAEELEMLGERVRQRVRDHSGVLLEWEIKRIGKPRTEEKERAVA